MENAALKLFKKSDRENKGFIVKRDMQRMKDEIMLPPEQLEIVFDTLDKKKNGYLTLDQFLKGFREYLFITSTDDNNAHQYLEETEIKNDFNEELNHTLNLVKETNVLKTSADELEYITEQIKNGTTCDISHWEVFLRDLNHDLQTYKNANHKLEKLIRQKDSQHQLYVKKIFEEIEQQMKDEKRKKECYEQTQKRIKEELKQLRAELSTKDEFLQQLSYECKELKQQMIKLKKKEEETSLLNSELMSQQVYYENELEAERLKREHIQNLLDNARRRFSIEKSQCFKEGFDLARRVVHVQEEGLLQQYQMLKDIQHVLEDT
ncbi:EF-hand calcium-binding domain-containing protein 4A-like [Planococcus citri]|uniref:EF-hand calcium-binding domain-containing protein 4A-like n=1 Tax=Planococcus citri TaxID=170843 RepID=UPI0031F764C5